MTTVYALFTVDPRGMCRRHTFESLIPAKESFAIERERCRYAHLYWHTNGATIGETIDEYRPWKREG